MIHVIAALAWVALLLCYVAQWARTGLADLRPKTFSPFIPLAPIAQQPGLSLCDQAWCFLGKEMADRQRAAADVEPAQGIAGDEVSNDDTSLPGCSGALALALQEPAVVFDGFDDVVHLAAEHVLDAGRAVQRESYD